MSKLILVRHGKSIFNQENRFTGWTDVDVAPEGVQEAKKTAEIIQKKRLAYRYLFFILLEKGHPNVLDHPR